jgi:membrane protein implicated in regulation of membrane protease activity
LYKEVKHEMNMDYEVLSWLIAFVVFLIVEAATFGLASIFFAFGAIVALVAALIVLHLGVQIALFVVVSAVTLYFTRPLAKKYVNARRMPTNADRMLNMVGIVTEAIDNIAGTGAVTVGGKTWTARSQSGENIGKGEKVRAESIEGVKLIVRPAADAPAEDKQTASKAT